MVAMVWQRLPRPGSAAGSGATHGDAAFSPLSGGPGSQSGNAFLAAIVLLCALISPAVFGAQQGGRLLSMEVEMDNRASLQRGARLFRNYCLSCHSAAYMRYNRMGRDLGLTERVLLENFIFDPSHKIADTMTIAMDEVSHKRYFGVVAPDLSVTARAHGADWLYTYLKTFYLDPQRPFGVNNLAQKNVNMPHVLWDLQGMQRAVYETVEGSDEKRIVGLELVKPGLQSEEEYDRTARDLVNFLVYLGEPVKLQRVKIGILVLAYLFVLLAIVWFLKREYWRDVH